MYSSLPITLISVYVFILQKDVIHWEDIVCGIKLPFLLAASHIKVLFQGLDSLLPVQLPANISLETTDDGSRT